MGILQYVELCHFKRIVPKYVLQTFEWHSCQVQVRDPRLMAKNPSGIKTHTKPRRTKQVHHGMVWVESEEFCCANHPGGISAISRRSRSAPPVSEPTSMSTPKAVAALFAATAFGVDDISNRHPGCAAQPGANG